MKNNFESGLIIIHHTATSQDKTSLVGINNNHKKRFFDDLENNLKQPIGKINGIQTQYPYIAYHYIILNGEVFQNRSHDQFGYHSGDRKINSGSIAICVCGNFENENISEKNFFCLKNLLEKLNKEIKISDIKGHRDIKNTACPGKNLYNKIIDLKNFIFKNKGMYEDIFNNEFGGKSEVYSDLESLISNSKIDRETFFMLLIGIERASRK